MMDLIRNVEINKSILDSFKETGYADKPSGFSAYSRIFPVI